MLLQICRAKIHGATVTGKKLNYTDNGSITISKEMLDITKIFPYEKVLVGNLNNGTRFETYVVRGEEPNSIVLNGAAARLGEIGDRLIIFTFGLVEESKVNTVKPVLLYVDSNNNVVKTIQ